MPEIEYLNLLIDNSSENVFSVHLLDNDGNTIHENEFNYEDIDQNVLITLEESIGEKNPQIGVNIQKIGSELFNAIFKDEILELYFSLLISKNFIRIKLIFTGENPFLLSLPWEFMFDGSNYISAYSNISLFRSIKEFGIPNVEIEGQINLLVLISNPLNLSNEERLQIEIEKSYIANAVSSSDNIKITFENKASLKNIQDLLDNNDFHIIHYIGHGSYSEDDDKGYLILEDDNGNKKPVDNETISKLFSGYPEIKLVVLSGCQTAKTSSNKSFRDLSTPLIAKGIPSVISMQYPIIDESAVALARKLYTGISSGKPIDKSITDARKELLIKSESNSVDFGTPVLYTTNPDSIVLKTEKIENINHRSGRNPNIIINLERLGLKFIGRHKEIRQIKTDFVDHDVRAVIIHGFGGIGKTVTASHVAEDLSNVFDYIYTFDCKDLTIEKFLKDLSDFFLRNGLDSLSDILKEDSTLDLKISYFADVLAEIKILVVLDNFESLLSEDKKYFKIKDDVFEKGLQTFINQCPDGIKFLITSRYTFKFTGDRLTSHIDEINIGELSEAEAIMLMGKLPGIKREEFGIKQEIFNKIGGHPYTLNLFNKHARMSSVKEVLGYIDGINTKMIEFTLLEKAYDNLMPESKELLCRSSIFEEPVPILGLQRIMKVDDVTNEIEELLHWGLIIKIESDRGVVYQIHTLIKDFLKKKCDLDWTEINNLAGEFFEELSIRHDNIWDLLIAHKHYLKARKYNKAGSIANELAETLFSWGFTDIVLKLNDITTKTTENSIKATAIMQKGLILEYQGDYKEAAAKYGESLKSFKKAEDYPSMAVLLTNFGVLRDKQGKYKEAIEYYLESLNLSESIGDQKGVVTNLVNIGVLYVRNGKFLQGEKYLRYSLELVDSKDLKLKGLIFHTLGNMYNLTKRYDEALNYGYKSYAIRKELGDKYGSSSCLHLLGIVNQNLGNYDDSVRFSKESLKISNQLGYANMSADTLGVLGSTYLLKEEYKKALKYYIYALILFRRLGSAKTDTVMRQIDPIVKKYNLKYFEESYNEILRLIEKEGINNLISELVSE